MCDDYSGTDLTDPAGRTWSCAGYAGSLVITLFLFWPVITGSSEVGFRDSASLYQPLFEWTRNQWLAGHVPLWCPLDNWGSPVVADAASSVFYPGKLIFLFGGAPFPVLFGLFLAFHVWWAVLGTRWCAKQMGLSTPAQWLVAASFGFGGAVLFQTCNVVFLVGASWLPWALGCIWLVCRHDSTGVRAKWGIRLAVVMALMVLGGDPQIAFHTGLVAALWWVGNAVFKVDSSMGMRLRNGLGACGLCLTVAAIAVLLAAVQVLPSLEWARQSERSIGVEVDRIQSMVQRPDRDSHRDAIYQFSQSPWTVVEMIWPNVLGKLDFATNWRWSSAIAGADRVWTGSLYVGLVGLLFGIVFVLRGQKQKLDYLLVVTVVLFLLGSFGWYGPGWIINELQRMRGGTGFPDVIGEPTGGVYWLLETLIPGYSGFRYPAKLFVVAALPICLLGGRGFDHVFAQHREQDLAGSGLRFTGRVLLISVVLGAVCLWSRGTGQRLFSLVTADVAGQVLSSVIHGVVVLGLLAGLLTVLRQKNAWSPGIARIIVLLAVVDLIVAVSWTVCIVKKTEQTVPKDLESTAVYRSPNLDVRLFPGWDRLSTQLDIDRRTCWPKHHLRQNRRIIGSFHSIQPIDEAFLLAAIERLDVDRQRRVLGLLGVGTSVEHDAAEDHQIGWARWDAQPRFYFCHSMESLPAIDERDDSAIANRTSQVIQWLAEKASPGQVLAECAPSIIAGIDQSADALTRPARVQLLDEVPNRIRLTCALETQRLLVAADYYDENWKAWASDENGNRFPLETIRVNRVQRGLLVPAGNYEIEMVYRPTSFLSGCGLSCLAWVLLTGWWIRDRRRR